MVLSILHHLRMPCIFVTCFSCWAHYFGLLGKVTWCGPVCAGHVFLPHQHEAGQLVLWKHSIQCLNRGSYLYENWESESCLSSAKWRDGVVNACQLFFFFSSPSFPLIFRESKRAADVVCVGGQMEPPGTWVSRPPLPVLLKYYLLCFRVNWVKYRGECIGM